MVYDVYDGLPARIRACGARLGLANCGVATDLAERSPPTLWVAGQRLLKLPRKWFPSVYNPVIINIWGFCMKNNQSSLSFLTKLFVSYFCMLIIISMFFYIKTNITSFGSFVN